MAARDGRYGGDEVSVGRPGTRALSRATSRSLEEHGPRDRRVLFLYTPAAATGKSSVRTRCEAVGVLCSVEHLTYLTITAFCTPAPTVPTIVSISSGYAIACVLEYLSVPFW